MKTTTFLPFPVLTAWILMLPFPGFSQNATVGKAALPDLGQAATKPANLVSKAPPVHAPQPQVQVVTGGFSVNTSSREEVRSFYNAIYPTSDNVPENCTADVSGCSPGDNANAFQQAELRRINWFRSMAGLPASILLDPIDNYGSQQMAVIMSANNALNHDPPSSYECYNTFAASYAGGDQCLGADGAEATTSFIWDYGASNNEVGHRRWILYPPETIMGVGDVAGSGTNAAANLTYVFDSRSFGAYPTIRQPFVSWPPEGYVPYQVVFPYWSFGISNADFTGATVTMTSNGVTVATDIQPYKTGYGDNTLVWVPMGLDATTGGTSFPFSGTDTVYNVTVANITNNGSVVQYSYSVTVFDPGKPGADYVPTTLSGPSQVGTGQGAVYTATPPTDPHVTSYNFLISQLASGNLADSGSNGLVNFTLTPGPNYPPTTNQPFSSGMCFNLEHLDTNAAPQLLQLNEELLPASNTTVSFQSELGFATSNEVARVQVSTDSGQSWTNLFTEPGNGSYESSFTPHTLSLSNYAGDTVLLRFDFDYLGGEYESGGFPLGWYFTGIVITNTQALVNQVTNNSSVTNIISGDLEDSALDGLINFSMTSPFPYYYVITNPPAGSEPDCFHLTHLDPTSQFMQLNEVLLPSTNSTVGFSSQLAYATSDETARVQASTNNGASWDDLFVEAGSNGSGETSFTPHTLSLSNYTGQLTLLRFNYAFTGGSYYPYGDNYVGWNIEDILLTNVQQQAITIIDTSNFTFTPSNAATYLLQAQPVIFNQFVLPFGPVKEVNATSTPVISMATPVISNNQILLNFNIANFTNSIMFTLLQSTNLLTGWTTNASATLTTNTPGSSYRFTTTYQSIGSVNPVSRYFRVQSP